MNPNQPYRCRRGSIIVTLIGGLIFVALFFSVYCFKQWQVNQSGAQYRAAQQAQKKPLKNHRWLSPDRRLAFMQPPTFTWGRRTFKLVDHETGQVLFESTVEADIESCKWREDSKACAVEYDPGAGSDEVVLLLIEGDQVTRCRPAGAIETARFLPDRHPQLPLQWEHTVRLGDFCPDGDLQINWVGRAKKVRSDRRVWMTLVECQFKIGYTSDGDVFVMESLPQGKPQTFDW